MRDFTNTSPKDFGNRKTCCKPKDFSGLCILNLDSMNNALLAELFWTENETGLLEYVLLIKYVKNECISKEKHIVGDYQFWTSI